MPELASVIWADGPSSMPQQPPKSKIRAWGAWLEASIDNGNVNVLKYNAYTDGTHAAANDVAFQAAADAAAEGDTIIIPPGNYDFVTGVTGSKQLTWEVYGNLMTGQNWADILPGTVTVFGFHTSIGGPSVVSSYSVGNIPATLPDDYVDIRREYYRSYWNGGAGPGRLSGFDRIIDVQAGASGIHSTDTKVINIVGQPGQTVGNGNYVADSALTRVLAPASTGPIPDSAFAGNDYVYFAPAAANWWNAAGREVDMDLEAPCTYRWAYEAISLGSYGGSARDCAYHMDSFSAAAPWGDGLVAGGGASAHPALHPNASLVKAIVSSGISYGMYLYNTPVSQSYLYGNDINLKPGEASFAANAQVIKIGNPTSASDPQIHGYSSGDGVPNVNAEIRFNGGSASPYSGNLIFRAANVLLNSPVMRPVADNTTDVGSGTFRMKQYYGVNVAISSSDLRMKRLRGGFTDAELDAIGEVSLIIFQWLESVEEKGDAARLHAGAIAQQVNASFEQHGLDASRYGLWCEDTIFEEVDEPFEEDEVVWEDFPTTEDEITIVDGNAILVKRPVTKKKQKTEQFPLLNEDGSPVMSDAKPEKHIHDDKGKLVQIIPAIPSQPMTHSRVVTVKVPNVKKVMQDSGKTRLGLRYEQLLVMRQAWLEREVSRLAARIN